MRRIREGGFDTALVVMARTRWVSMVRLGRVPVRIASTWRPANTLWGFRIPVGEFHPEVFVSNAEAGAERVVAAALELLPLVS